MLLIGIAAHRRGFHICSSVFFLVPERTVTSPSHVVLKRSPNSYSTLAEHLGRSLPIATTVNSSRPASKLVAPTVQESQHGYGSAFSREVGVCNKKNARVHHGPASLHLRIVARSWTRPPEDDKVEAFPLRAGEAISLDLGVDPEEERADDEDKEPKGAVKQKEVESEADVLARVLPPAWRRERK